MFIKWLENKYDWCDINNIINKYFTYFLVYSSIILIFFVEKKVAKYDFLIVNDNYILEGILKRMAYASVMDVFI